MAKVILIAILAIILVRVAWGLLRGIFLGMGYQPPGGARNNSVGLVRDPVCGMFVMPSDALTSGSGSETRYFCSEKCRQQYSQRA